MNNFQSRNEINNNIFENSIPFIIYEQKYHCIINY